MAVSANHTRATWHEHVQLARKILLYLPISITQNQAPILTIRAYFLFENQVNTFKRTIKCQLSENPSQNE